MSKMIKYLSILTAAVLLCVMLVSAFAADGEPAAATDSYIIGDVDGDGDVTIIDVTIIQRFLAHMQDDPDGMYAIRGDVDGDGSLTSMDAAWIMRYKAMMDTPYPIGEAYVAPTEPPTEPVKPTAKPDPYELPPV